MKHHRNERGVALIICLFALLLLSGIGIGMMYMADTETVINRNYRDSQQAYFAAAGGLQEVRQRLMPGVVFAAPTKLPTNGDAASVTYVLNWDATVAKAAITPWDSASTYFDDEFCKEPFVNGAGPGLLTTDPNPTQVIACPKQASSLPTGTYYTTVDSNMPSVGTSAALPYRWVRVTLKANNTARAPYYVGTAASPNNFPICWDGTRQLPKPAGWVTCDDDPPPDGTTYLKSVYVLTSLAVTPAGSRRMAQMEVANNPPFVTNAAVDSQDHVSLSGKLGINGFDFCSCDMANCTTTAGITTCPGRAGKACDHSKWAIYSNGTVDNPNSSETIVAGRTPPTAQCDPGRGITSGCDWPYDIPALIARFHDSSSVDVTKSPNYNWTCTGTPLNCGTHTSANFGVPPDLPPNPVDNPIKAGSPPISKQTTYIPGNVKLTSAATGNGVLIIDGDLEINGGLQFYGLILVRGVIKFTGGGSNATNIYGAVLAGQESIDNLDTTLGGSAVIQFNRCALLNNTNPQPPALLATHEVTY